MIKTEFLLQLFIFSMTAAIISLLSVRFFPSNLLAARPALASTLISPVPISHNIDDRIQPPEQITIRSIDLSLPIAKATITGNEWTLFDDRVSWLSTSAVAGRGNVILYAHNRAHLFGNLKKVSLGDQIVVSQGGKTYTYQIADKHKVLPTEVQAVVSTNNQLVLYTCDGTFDQRRLIVIAYPQKS